MPKKTDIQKEILKYMIEQIDINSLSPLVHFNENDNETIKLEDIDVNNLNISNFYNVLKNSNKEEQLSFFKKNINEHLEIFKKLFKYCGLDKKNLFCVLDYDAIVYLIENGINLLDIVPREPIAKSDSITLQEKLALLENYYLKADYQTVEDIINLIFYYHDQQRKDEMNEIFIQVESNDLKINKNYYFAQDTYSKYELDEMFKHIKCLNKKRISLNDILYKIFTKEHTNDGVILLNKYDEEIKKRLLNHEAFNENLFSYENFELIKLFMKKYTSIIFTENNLEYAMNFYVPFFCRLLEKDDDILKYYPFLISKMLDNEKIKKLIFLNKSSQTSLTKYYIEKKGDFKEITNCLIKDNYSQYLGYFSLLEKKLRNEDITLEEIKNIKTIFSNEYIRFLSYLNKHDNKELFEFGYQLLLQDVKKYIVIKDDEGYYKEILKIYYKRCIKGFPLSKLLYFNNELELCVHKRFNIEINGIDDYKLKQILAINAKEYLKVIKDYCNFFKHNGVVGVTVTECINHDIENVSYNQLLLCGLMIFPFDKLTKILTECQYDYKIMELLFDSIDKSKIKISKDGKIEYNQKLINLFFGKENGVLKKLNTENIIVNNFASIYNNWDKIIKFYPSQKLSLSMIKSFIEKQLFQSYDMGVEYFDIKPYLFYIGNSNLAISNIKKYYLDMKNRYYATIPQVKGDYYEYHYEMLNTNNPLTLAVGKLTNCCFRIDGYAKTAVQYTMLNPDNRIFCVWKDNVLIAQSWVWRNGNVVCFDNIECIKKEEKNVEEWFNCYLKATEEIYKESFYYENETERIKMITLGRNSRDVKISSLNNYIRLTKKEDMVLVKNKLKDLLSKIYTDADGHQVVLYQEPSFLTKDNYSNCNNIYLDSRSEVKKTNNINNKNFKQHIQIINALIGKETPLDSIKEGEIGDGWYHYKTSDNKEYAGIFSYDPRAHQEYELSLKKKFK